MAAERPHLLQREADGPLERVSTDEIMPLVVAHSFHDGIAFFPECHDCQIARDAGKYPHWFPVGE